MGARHEPSADRANPFFRVVYTLPSMWADADRPGEGASDVSKWRACYQDRMRFVPHYFPAIELLATAGFNQVEIDFFAARARVASARLAGRASLESYPAETDDPSDMLAVHIATEANVIRAQRLEAVTLASAYADALAVVGKYSVAILLQGEREPIRISGQALCFTYRKVYGTPKGNPYETIAEWANEVAIDESGAPLVVNRNGNKHTARSLESGWSRMKAAIDSGTKIGESGHPIRDGKGANRAQYTQLQRLMETLPSARA